jgi:hypothetical protein
MTLPRTNVVTPRPIKLTPAEANTAARSMMDTFREMERIAPQTTNFLASNPEMLWGASELQLMTGADARITTNMTEALMRPPSYGVQIAEEQMPGISAYNEYTYNMFDSPTQQMFWTQMASRFDVDGRNVIANVFAGLSPKFADRVASRAFMYAQQHGLQTQSDLDDLLVRIFDWSRQESEFQEFEEGGWGALIKPVKYVEDEGFRPAKDRFVEWIHGPEEAVRRQGLTVGQEVAWGIAGLEQDSMLGTVLSGSIDATIQIIFDPLIVFGKVAGALRTAARIPRAATEAGRLSYAAKTIIPLSGRSHAPAALGRGPLKRTVYALASHTTDELIENMGRTGVADDIMRLAQAENRAGANRKYPFLENLSDAGWQALARSSNADEIIEVMKHVSIADKLTNPNAVEAAKEAFDVTVRARQARMAGALNDELIGLGDYVADAAVNAGGDAVDLAAGVWRRADNGYVVRAAQNADGNIKNVFKTNSRVAQVGDEFVEWATKYGLDAEFGADAEVIRMKMMTGADALNPQEMDVVVAWANRSKSNVVQGGDTVRLVLDDSVLLRGRDLPATGQIFDPTGAKAVLRDRAALDNLVARPQETMVIKNFPTRVRPDAAKSTFWNSSSWMARFGRRQINAWRQAEPDGLTLLGTRQGARDLRKILNHYGVPVDEADRLINEFMLLDAGDRLSFATHEVIQSIGKATKTPLLELNLLEIYDRLGSTGQFSVSKLGTTVDKFGRVHHVPIFPHQLTDKVPFPIAQMDEIIKRASTAGLKGIKFAPRGLTGGTQTRRAQLVERFRNKLNRTNPEMAAQLDDNDLVRLAYSFVDDYSGGGRGKFATGMREFRSQVWDNLFNSFKKAMLVLRPIQWVFRVTVLEEQIRSVVFGMPSAYGNPISWMADLRLMRNSKKAAQWRELNAQWVSGTADNIIGEARTVETAVDAVRQAWPDAAEAILGRREFDSVNDVRRAVSGWLSKATRRTNDKNALALVPHKVKQRALKIDKVEDQLIEAGLARDFNIVEDLPEIQQKLIHAGLADEMATSGVQPYVWSAEMPTRAKETYGRVWGQKMYNVYHDPVGRIGIERAAYRARGEAIPLSLAEDTLVNSSRWDLMGPQARKMFPDAADDIEAARRYLNEVIDPEIEAIFGTLWAGGDKASIIDDMLTARRVKLTRDGTEYEFSFSRSNQRGLTSTMSDYAVNQGHLGAELAFPQEIVGAAFDPRYGAVDQKGVLSRIANQILQTFGEDATQVFVRRPAFVNRHRAQYKYWKELGMSDELASTLAREQAIEMVNWAFYNLAEAPAAVKKINRFIPFFAAAYEVAGTWFYKMPAFLGGGGFGGALLGAPQFARYFDRIIQAGVAMGLVDIEESDSGKRSYNLKMVSHDNIEEATGREQISHMMAEALHTPATILSHIIGLRNEVALPEAGYEIAIGHPLNAFDYGALSYANFTLGLAPMAALPVTSLARMAGVSDHRRTEVILSGVPGGHSQSDGR